MEIQEQTTKADKRLLKNFRLFNKWVKHGIGKHKNIFIHMSKKSKRKK